MKELTQLTFNIVESPDFLGKGALEIVDAFIELLDPCQLLYLDGRG